MSFISGSVAVKVATGSVPFSAYIDGAFVLRPDEPAGQRKGEPDCTKHCEEG